MNTLKHCPLTFALLLMSFSVTPMPLDNLDTLTWSNRLLLVFTEENKLQTFHEKLNTARAEVEDRDIVWFLISDRRMKTNFTAEIDAGLQAKITGRWMKQNDERTQVILIGKDGYEKLRSNRLDLIEIFGKIDLMPMRQFEMRSATED